MQHTDNSTVRANYDRIAFVYDVVDLLIPNSWRLRAVDLTKGRTLEVGVGSGLNLPLYPASCSEVVGVDISPRMLAKAAKRAPRCSAPVILYEMDAQSLSFADDSFDTVLATCVFCTVPEPIKGLREMRRVCKPGGTIILVEHMRSRRPWLGKVMDWLNPLSVSLLGDHINRHTVENVRKSGIQVVEVADLSGDVVRLIVGRK
ncbi:MAG: Methyltransferase type 11 [Anaerosporomusa subterranea]|jgi:ubiquinone/menaquinone biosynthesis C-methylase UbiE|nr:Methyltransferase type 11 [Anaerosporomusa subterranea]